MSLSFEFFIYLLAGLALLFLFFSRKAFLCNVMPDKIPILNDEAVKRLRALLTTAYGRTLYLAISFLLLSYSTAFHRQGAVKAFFMLTTVVLFFANIPPRHKIAKLLLAHGVTYRQLKQYGVRF